jgi:hypothetical protein
LGEDEENFEEVDSAPSLSLSNIPTRPRISEEKETLLTDLSRPEVSSRLMGEGLGEFAAFP